MTDFTITLRLDVSEAVLALGRALAGALGRPVAPAPNDEMPRPLAAQPAPAVSSPSEVPPLGVLDVSSQTAPAAGLAPPPAASLGRVRWTAEMRAILARDWERPVPKAAIRAELEALAGRPLPGNKIASRAAQMGLKRHPDMVPQRMRLAMEKSPFTQRRARPAAEASAVEMPQQAVDHVRAHTPPEPLEQPIEPIRAVAQAAPAAPPSHAITPVRPPPAPLPSKVLTKDEVMARVASRRAEPVTVDYELARRWGADRGLGPDLDMDKVNAKRLSLGLGLWQLSWPGRAA